MLKSLLVRVKVRGCESSNRAPAFRGTSQKSSVAEGNTDLVLGGYPENTWLLNLKPTSLPSTGVSIFPGAETRVPHSSLASKMKAQHLKIILKIILHWHLSSTGAHPSHQTTWLWTTALTFKGRVSQTRRPEGREEGGLCKAGRVGGGKGWLPEQTFRWCSFLKRWLLRKWGEQKSGRGELGPGYPVTLGLWILLL